MHRVFWQIMRVECIPPQGHHHPTFNTVSKAGARLIHIGSLANHCRLAQVKKKPEPLQAPALVSS
jgi:hypothetical protein